MKAWNDANNLKNYTNKVIIPSLETGKALPGQTQPNKPANNGTNSTGVGTKPTPTAPKPTPPKTLTNVKVECPDSGIGTSLITEETVILFTNSQPIGPLTVVWTMSATTTIELSDTQKNQLASIGLTDKFTNADFSMDMNILEFGPLFQNLGASVSFGDLFAIKVAYAHTTGVKAEDLIGGTISASAILAARLETLNVFQNSSMSFGIVVSILNRDGIKLAINLSTEISSNALYIGTFAYASMKVAKPLAHAMAEAAGGIAKGFAKVFSWG